jgi:hypothetical protein
MSDWAKIIGGALAVWFAAILLWAFVPSQIDFIGWCCISWAAVIIIRIAVPSKKDEQ